MDRIYRTIKTQINNCFLHKKIFTNYLINLFYCFNELYLKLDWNNRNYTVVVTLKWIKLRVNKWISVFNETPSDHWKRYLLKVINFYVINEDLCILNIIHTSVLATKSMDGWIFQKLLLIEIYSNWLQNGQTRSSIGFMKKGLDWSNNLNLTCWLEYTFELHAMTIYDIQYYLWVGQGTFYTIWNSLFLICKRKICIYCTIEKVFVIFYTSWLDLQKSDNARRINK